MPEKRRQLVLTTIREHGGRLVRHKRHLAYRFPTGRVFVVPKTPSDHRAWHNSLSALRRFLMGEADASRLSIRRWVLPASGGESSRMGAHITGGGNDHGFTH